MTDNRSKWKIVDAIYKCVVVALLIVAVVLLNSIRNRQQTFPTVANFKKIGQSMILIRQAYSRNSRIVYRSSESRVAGGNVTVDGSVQIER